MFMRIHLFCPQKTNFMSRRSLPPIGNVFEKAFYMTVSEAYRIFKIPPSYDDVTFLKKWEEFLSCIIYKCQTSEIICSLSYCLPYVRSFPSFHCSFQWPYNIMLPVLYYRAIRQKNETTKRSHIRHI